MGATMNFSIAPAWFHTLWFIVFCAAIVIVMISGIQRLRVMQSGNMMNARFDERLAERTRMARELHDTLLPTIQACSLVARNALENPDDASRMRHALEQLSGWLLQAAQEGRDAVNALRTSTMESNSLAAALKRALEDCRSDTSMETAISITGEVREMHPVVRDEIYRLGYEAIRNARAHSAGSLIEVALNYGNNLSLNIRDNGIGIAPAVVETGRAGHYGLQGMRERADRIGAQLVISTSANTGTQVDLLVPGNVIFCVPCATAPKLLLRESARVVNKQSCAPRIESRCLNHRILGTIRQFRLRHRPSTPIVQLSA